MKATWVSKSGCYESLFEISKQTFRKEKARKRKKKQIKDSNVFQKGVDGQKAKKKIGVLKGKPKTKKHKEKTKPPNNKKNKRTPFAYWQPPPCVW